MSQLVGIIKVRHSGAPIYLGNSEDSDPIFSSNPGEIMQWLCDGARFRFNQRRSIRTVINKHCEGPGSLLFHQKDVVSKKDKLLHQKGDIKKIFDGVLVALGYNPVDETRAEAKRNHHFLNSIPSLILYGSDGKEEKNWFAGLNRKRASGGGIPKFQHKSDDARFSCLVDRGRNAAFQRTGKKSGVVLIKGFNSGSTKKCDAWTISIKVRISQTIRDYSSISVNWTKRTLSFTNAPLPIETSGKPSNLGIDRGIKIPAATSDGKMYVHPDTTKLRTKAKMHQCDMSRKQAVWEKQNPGSKFSSSRKSKAYQASRTAKAKCETQIANIIDNSCHQITTDIVRNCAGGTVFLEELNLVAMSKSAKGTKENPGKNVKAKSGLNRELRRTCLGKIARYLEYKLALVGGKLEYVPAAYTSQRCSECGHIAAENRKNQAIFCCVQCGYTANADYNAARNILLLGLKLWSYGGEKLPNKGRDAAEDGEAYEAAALSASKKSKPGSQFQAVELAYNKAA